MKVTDVNFLKAKKDKKLRAFLVINWEGEGTIMRLCIDAKVPYKTDTETIFVEAPTDIRIDRYGSETNGRLKVCFHCDVAYMGNRHHIKTFLDAIKKDSEVKFNVVSNNNSEVMNKHNLVCHELYGFVDDKCYLLSKYVGENNFASPIQ